MPGSSKKRGWGRLRLLLLLLAAAALFFPHAGRFLVHDDPVERADIVLVLSGDPVPRALGAKELFLEKKAGQVVVIPEPPDPLQKELVKLGLADPAQPPLSRRILEAGGVPPERIAFLPRHADGTVEEAARFRQFLREQRLVTGPRRTVVLVTGKFHSRRARLLFRWALRKEPVTVLVSPTRYDLSDPQRWWTRPRQALNVVVEYQKFLWNLLTLPFGVATIHS